MQRRVRFVACLAALLAVTLGIKLALFDQTYAEPDDAAFEAELAAAFEAEGFTIQREAMLGRHAIRAQRGDCEILVARMDSRGHARDRFALASAGLGPISYVYRGESSREFPRIVPLLEEQLWRFSQPVGVEVKLSPIVAFTSTGDCPAPTTLAITVPTIR